MSTSVRFFVDGFNVYHGIRETRRQTHQDCRWLDVASLCRSVLHLIDPSAVAAGIDYFSALAHHREVDRPGTVARHPSYLEALRATGVTPHLGVFKPKDVRYHSRSCDVVLRRHEEKETDVAIAAAIVEAAATRDCDVLAIVSGDTDLVPPQRAARRAHRNVGLYCLFPPYRGNRAFEAVFDGAFKIRP